MNLRVRSRRSLATCGYCHDALRPEEAAPACDGCGTVLHSACAAEVGCATLGCPRTPCADPRQPFRPWRPAAEVEAEAAAARSWERLQAQAAAREERYAAVREQLGAKHPDPDGLGYRPRVVHLLVGIALVGAIVGMYRVAWALEARGRPPRAHPMVVDDVARTSR